jgi:hypothetical protein
MRKYLIYIIVTLSQVFAEDVAFNTNFEFSQSTVFFGLQGTLEYKMLRIHSSYQLFSLAHPIDRFRHAPYQRHEGTLVSDENYFEVNSPHIKVNIGRKSIHVGPTVQSSVFWSSQSLPMDAMRFDLQFKKLEYTYLIAQLDDRVFTDENNDNLVYRRWYYYKRLAFKFTERFSVGLVEIAVLTGNNRGIELNYVNPFSLFQLEQLHGNSRHELGWNNDNFMAGFDFEYRVESLRFYNEWVVDDYQIDAENQPRHQNVFGMVFGMEYIKNKSEFCIEYGYASPWLYINNGMFTNVEFHGYSLGLRHPNSQSLTISGEYEFNDKFDVGTQLFFQQRGTQTVQTKWNNVNNPIGAFEFSEKSIPEIELFLNFKQYRYLKSLNYFHNWLGQGGDYLVLKIDFPQFGFDLE